MPQILQHRRGTTVELSTERGSIGEFWMDETKNTIVVMDGSTLGGHPLAKQNEIPTVPANINDLDDVTLTNSANGDLITYSNGDWINSTISNIITGTNVSLLNNDAGYITAAQIAGGTLTIDVNNTGDLTGSVYSDGGTLLVDAANSMIVGPIEAPSIVSASYIDAATGVNASGFGSSTPGNFINLGVNASSINVVTDIDMLTHNITNASNISANTVTGSLTGSVFSANSTLLVDGVNGSIPYSVISNVQVTESDLSVDWAGIVGTQIQTNGLPINTFTNGDLEVRGILSFNAGSADFANTSIQNFAPGNVYANSEQYLYITSKHAGGSATNVAFTYDTGISNVKQTFYGKTEFGNNGQAPVVDFSGVLIQGFTGFSTLTDDISIDAGGAAAITLSANSAGISIGSGDGVNINNTGAGTINIGHSTNQTNFAGTVDLSNADVVLGANTTVSGLDYSDISNTPTTLSGYGIVDAATSAQGALADTAVQPGNNAGIAYQYGYGAYDAVSLAGGDFSVNGTDMIVSLTASANAQGARIDISGVTTGGSAGVGLIYIMRRVNSDPWLVWNAFPVNGSDHHFSHSFVDFYNTDGSTFDINATDTVEYKLTNGTDNTNFVSYNTAAVDFELFWGFNFTATEVPLSYYLIQP